MRLSSSRTLGTPVLLLALSLVTSCGGDGPAAPVLSGPNTIRLVSDAGDWIGGGKSYEYTAANAKFVISATGNHLQISVVGDEGWHSDLVLPSTLTQLQKGTFQNLDSYPFFDPAEGGFDWSGEGRGCNTSRSWVAIDNIAYAGTTLVALDLRFEQHCDGNTPALRGTVHWDAAEPTPTYGPVVPVPTTLWRPPSSSLPASGNYVYWEKPADAPVGAKFPYLWTPQYSTITVSATNGLLQLSASGQAGMRMDFQTMTGVNAIRVGYYAGLQRYLNHNPLKGGMDVVVDGYGCNALLGWVAIDRVEYTLGRLSALDLRFEQACEGQAATNGAVHWTG